MGRSRSYHEDAVLAGAMQAFRRKGYLGVSIKDLEAATGLTGGSIYNAYGDKAGLFAAAFAHYNRAVLRRRLAEHAPPAAGLGGLRSLFRSLLHEPNGETFGCLITNAAIEFGAADRPPAVAEGLQLLSECFAERLAASGCADPVPIATRLLVLYQGMLVLVRAGWDKPTLERFIDHEFDGMEGHRNDA